MKEKKTTRALERIVRGFSNHRRIQIMELLKQRPELSVQEISDEVKAGYKTVAQHIQKLAIAGLVLKRSQGRDVCHALTRRAHNILSFLRTIE